MTLLSKSKFLNGIQCPRLLWASIHKKEMLPEFDITTLNNFKQGNEVGELAKKLFPEGIDIPTENFSQNIQLSKEALTKNKPLFEPAIMIEQLYSRADVLDPVGDEWDIIEVKSGTKVKDVNVWDVAFQKHVYEKAGLKIRKCFLMHINNKYVRKGELNIEELFVKQDITKEVEERLKEVPEKISEMFDILNYSELPENVIGKHCDDPYGCPLKDDCWSFLPEGHVFQLTRGGSKSFELFDNKIYAIKDIPEDFKLTDKQGIQWDCEVNNKVHIHKESIKHFLSGLKYPLYYLDFETFNGAVPMFEGVKPYQQIPFQFSLHIVKEKGSNPEHIEFLYNGDGDPRKEFIEKLKVSLGEVGDIVAYNMAFEKGIISKIAEFIPEYKDWAENVNGRMVDLWVPFRNFSYYNPRQKGSASIKHVLPSLVGGEGYNGMDIADGMTASIEYFNSHYEEVEESKKSKVREDLLKYCGLDTEAMIWIISSLGEIVKN
jgi:hypothetical protein